MTDEMTPQRLEELLKKLGERCIEILEKKLEEFSKKLLEEFLKVLEEKYRKILKEKLEELLKAPREMYRENRGIISPVVRELLKELREKYGERSYGTLIREGSLYITPMGNNKLFEKNNLEYIRVMNCKGSEETLVELRSKRFLLRQKYNNAENSIDKIFGNFYRKYSVIIVFGGDAKPEDLPQKVRINFLLRRISNKEFLPMYFLLYLNLGNLIHLIKTGSFEEMLKECWRILRENFDIREDIEENDFKVGEYTGKNDLEVDPPKYDIT